MFKIKLIQTSVSEMPKEKSLSNLQMDPEEHYT